MTSLNISGALAIVHSRTPRTDMLDSPLEPDITVLVLYSLAGGVLLLVGLPLYLGKIPPNSMYGFRTQRTLANEKTWYAVNRVTGRGMLLAGIATLAVAHGLQWRGEPPSRAAPINLAVFVSGVLVTVVVSWLASRRSA